MPETPNNNTDAPQYHQTAGGVVLNEDDAILVLHRIVLRDMRLVREIRLPKGHIDPGETPEEAALREVREESGYGQLQIIADLGEARSEYHFQGRDHLRDERYFLMRLTAPERGVPEPQGEEEALFEPAWLAPEIAIARLSYESEQEFACRALAHLQENC